VSAGGFKLARENLNLGSGTWASDGSNPENLARVTIVTRVDAAVAKVEHRFDMKMA
jgi:hypothetical protein